MRICYLVLDTVFVIIKTWVKTLREIVRRVCEHVSSTINVIVEVCNKACNKWGPFKFLCKWVCKAIERVKTVWDWVCKDVIDRFFELVLSVIEYVYYILRWVCWVIELPFRLIAMWACYLGFEPQRKIRVCVKILTDSNKKPGVPLADVDTMMSDAAKILADCNIDLVEEERELVVKQQYLDSTTCDVGGMFSGFFVWFSQMQCAQPCTVTVYFVRDIVGSTIGCAYPGTNWVTIDAGGDGNTIVQEIGHLADLLHTSDPDNVMTNKHEGTGDQITKFQCCMFRTSRFSCS